MRTLFYFALCFVTLAPVLAYGQTQVYSPLVNIPGAGNSAGGFEQYINFLYGASISVAALLAVVKIIIAGAKYMLSGGNISSKSTAISDIQGAILGLLLILGAVIILEFINPQLIRGDIQFQPIAPPPTINTAGSSVSAALAADLQALMTVAGCGTAVDASTANFLVVGFNATTCANPANALGVFAQECLRRGGIIRGNPAEMRSGCSIPRTGIGAGGIRPAPEEFSIGNGYSMIFFANPLQSVDIDLSMSYSNNQAAVGNIVVYDAERHCQDIMDASAYEQYGQACLESIEELLFEPCGTLHSSVCNTGWCTHNAGRRSGNFGCELPYERFSASQVQTSYRSGLPASQQQNIYGRTEFEAGCAALGGQVRDIRLYRNTMDNLRCVRL